MEGDNKPKPEVYSFDQWFEKEGLYQLFEKSKRRTLWMRGFTSRTCEDSGWYNRHQTTPKKKAMEMVEMDNYCEEYVYLKYNRAYVEIYGRFKDWNKPKPRQ